MYARERDEYIEHRHRKIDNELSEPHNPCDVHDDDLEEENETHEEEAICRSSNKPVQVGDQEEYKDPNDHEV